VVGLEVGAEGDPVFPGFGGHTLNIGPNFAFVEK
jgi:hypothetical protein